MSLSHEHVGSKISAKNKIDIFSRAKLLSSLCHEVPCKSFISMPMALKMPKTMARKRERPLKKFFLFERQMLFSTLSVTVGIMPLIRFKVVSIRYCNVTSGMVNDNFSYTVELLTQIIYNVLYYEDAPCTQS